MLDLQIVSELREMLEDEVDELFDELLQLVPDELAAMSACLERGDLKSIELKAHQIKGSSANLGVMEFSHACGELEEGLRSGKTADISQQLDDLNNKFTLAVVEIKAMGSK